MIRKVFRFHKKKSRYNFERASQAMFKIFILHTYIYSPLKLNSFLGMAGREI